VERCLLLFYFLLYNNFFILLFSSHLLFKFLLSSPLLFTFFFVFFSLPFLLLFNFDTLYNVTNLLSLPYSSDTSRYPYHISSHLITSRPFTSLISFFSLPFLVLTRHAILHAQAPSAPLLDRDSPLTLP
jgi:hypothetical protein